MDEIAPKSLKYANADFAHQYFDKLYLICLQVYWRIFYLQVSQSPLPIPNKLVGLAIAGNQMCRMRSRGVIYIWHDCPKAGGVAFALHNLNLTYYFAIPNWKVLSSGPTSLFRKYLFSDVNLTSGTWSERNLISKTKLLKINWRHITAPLTWWQVSVQFSVITNFILSTPARLL